MINNFFPGRVIKSINIARGRDLAVPDGKTLNQPRPCPYYHPDYAVSSV